MPKPHIRTSLKALMIEGSARLVLNKPTVMLAIQEYINKRVVTGQEVSVRTLANVVDARYQVEVVKRAK